MSAGRFKEEQYRMNCVSRSWVWLIGSLLLGIVSATRLIRSGINLSLVPVVALHLVSKCTRFSVGAEWWEAC